MEKQEFLAMFNGYDKNYISSLYEDIKLCRNIECDIYTKEFVTPDIYYKLKKNEFKMGVTVSGYGVFEDCERRMICFSAGEYLDKYYEVDVIEIKNKSKFKVLSHKDYLGSIMALGIRRELFGDLVVDGDCCYLPASKLISKYILDNLITVGNSPCDLKIIDINKSNIPKINFEDKNIIVTSLRLDNMVSSICNISRSKSNVLIESGVVLINYLSCVKKEKLLDINDTITIRGYGKFKFVSIVGETGKGRIKVAIGKYIWVKFLGM